MKLGRGTYLKQIKCVIKSMLGKTLMNERILQSNVKQKAKK